MARERDESKRLAILSGAKRLFAARGFNGVSVSDLAREADLPIGSIYTYFESKESIVSTIVEEEWASFVASVEESILGSSGPVEWLSLVVDRFLPELLADADVVSIILTESGRSFRLEDKLERLAALVSGPLAELAASRGLAVDFTPARAKAAILVYFLGGLEAVRLAESAGVDIGPEDVIDFIRFSIKNSLGIDLGAGSAARPSTAK